VGNHKGPASTQPHAIAFAFVLAFALAIVFLAVILEGNLLVPLDTQESSPFHPNPHPLQIHHHHRR
jgi:hypothetical protein